MRTRYERSNQLAPAQQRGLIRRLTQYARRRSTSLEWYHGVGTVLRELAPKSSKRSIEGYAVDVFKNDKFKTTLYACRKFAEVISRSELRKLRGLNWAIVHHLIYADDDHRPEVVRKLQEMRRRKEQRGERLTPLEARLIVQEIRGKSPIRRAKQSRIPDLGPKSALRELTRVSEDWVRFSERWLKKVAAENGRRGKRSRPPHDQSEWLTLLEKATEAIEDLRKNAAAQLGKLSGETPRRAGRKK